MSTARAIASSTLCTLFGLGLAACVDDPAAEEAIDPTAPTLGSTQQGVSVCADGPTVFGIDVSRYQGTIDWQQIADAGVKYAWIQASRNDGDIDPTFDYNWKRAKEVGILRGAYQRFRPNQNVQSQIDTFLGKVSPVYEPGDLPPQLDFEDNAANESGAALEAKARQWLEAVEAELGLRPIIYTYTYFWIDQMDGANMTDYRLWMATYGADCPNLPAPWTEWTLHQYSASAVLPGITVNTVDVNRFNGTLEDLIALGSTPECGDGTCSAGESSDSCAADCPPCSLIGDDPTVLDDSGACFTAGGDQQFIRSETAGFQDTLRWTMTTSDAAASNYGEWALHFADGGRYRVEAYTAAPWAMSKQATYEITHDGETTAIEVDQTAVDGWTSLGEHTFAAGGGQSIRVNDNTGESNDSNTKLVFDAIRITRVEGGADGDVDGEGQGGDDGDGEGGEDGRDDGLIGAGCAAGGDVGGMAALLLAAAAWAARRRRAR